MTLLTRLALRNRALTLLVTTVLLVAGGWSVTQLKQELFPSIEAPNMVVVAVQPGAGPTAIAEEVTQPIEDALEGSDGLLHVSSTSRDGVATLSLEYEYGDDMTERQREVKDALADVALPSGTSTSVELLDPGAGAVYSLAVTGSDQAAVEEYVVEKLRPALKAADGVGSVDVSGGTERQVSVILDPDKLADAGLNASDVSSAIESANLSTSVGELDTGDTELPVTVASAATSLKQIKDIEVTGQGAASGSAPNQAQRGAAQQGTGAGQSDQSNQAGPSGQAAQPGADAGGSTTTPAAEEPAPARVGDLASVRLTNEGDGQTISRTDGEPAVTVEVSAEQGANTIDVVEAAQAAQDDTSAPAGVTTTEVINQAPEITKNVDGLVKDALIGMCLLVVVLLLFLGSLRPTLVAGISIPTSLVVAFLLMHAQDITVNLITIGGLSVAAARVIDDAIVVLENIYRLLESGMDRTEAVITGTGQVVPAITASTLATMGVFVPLAFTGGIVGSVFLGFSLTVVYALAASLVAAVTIVPVLAHMLLRPRTGDTRVAIEDRRMVRGYTAMLRWVLRHRAVTLVGAVVLLFAALGSLARIPTTLFAATEPTAYEITIETPSGQSLQTTSDQVAGLEDQIAGLGGVERFTSTMGTSTDGLAAFRGTNASARVTVTLTDDADPDSVKDGLEEALVASGVDGAIAATGSSGPDSSALSVQVLGDDYADVTTATNQIADALQDVEGLENLGSNADADRPELTVMVDQQRAAEAGLTSQTVSSLIRSALTSTSVTETTIDGADRTVSVLLDPDSVDSVQEVRELVLAGEVEVGDVATVEERSGPESRTAYDGTRSAEVTGVITDENTGGVSAEVGRIIDDLDLPASVSASVGGAAETQSDSFTALLIAMLVAIAAVYLIMVGAFASLGTPLVILLTLPLAAIGALPALLVTGYPLDLSAMIGLLMLIGIVVTNAIVLLDYVGRRKREGRNTRDALIEGGQVRLRPILMTASVTIGALLPLALGLTEGAILSASLATVVIGGLLSSTPLTLLVIPVVYSLADGFRDRIARHRKASRESPENNPGDDAGAGAAERGIEPAGAHQG
jgi:hydrophobic/amphiphilic exporter-1 (mainly G- bacteria), HAE1 family